jgi:hypothetical protein
VSSVVNINHVNPVNPVKTNFKLSGPFQPFLSNLAVPE